MALFLNPVFQIYSIMKKSHNFNSISFRFSVGYYVSPFKPESSSTYFPDKAFLKGRCLPNPGRRSKACSNPPKHECLVCVARVLSNNCHA